MRGLAKQRQGQSSLHVAGTTLMTCLSILSSVLYVKISRLVPLVFCNCCFIKTLKHTLGVFFRIVIGNLSPMCLLEVSIKLWLFIF